MDAGTTMVAGFAIWLTFVAVMAIVRSMTRVSMAKNKLGADEGSGSITGSELRNMISDAVNDATDPLYERIGQLERKMDTLRLESPAGQGARRPEIELPADDEYEALEEGAIRRRSRT